MNSATAREIVEVGGDPTDEVWRWLALRGPHGPSFTWGQTRGEPAGHVGIEHLERIVVQLGSTIPSFKERALRVVNAAMSSQSPDLARRAIQVAAVFGGEAELQRVKQLGANPELAVASDARACAFYLKHRRSP